MKVILVNGSPHAEGCTYTALKEVEKALNADGVETELFQLGTAPISGCIGCGVCRRQGKCFIDDKVNEFNEVHGSKPEDVFKDEEGLQTMRALGHNMAWLLGCIAAGRKAGLEPVREKKIYTNFVR